MKRSFDYFTGMKWKEVHYRWTGITLVALLLVLVIKDEQPGTFLEKYGVSFIITAFFWNGAFLLFMFYRRKFPLIRQTPKRLTLTVLTLLVFLLSGDFVFCLLLNGKSLSLAWTNPVEFFEYTPITLTITLVVGSFYENAYFFEQWRHTIQVNEALKNQQLRAQFEVLQNQMSPHFLFNSLNALTTLIGEDPAMAAKFTENMSDVYRYILQNKEKELVSLKEELEFVNSYAFLQKMRYPETLHIEINVCEHHEHFHIPPLSLQILFENSVKHNVVSRQYPLHVQIYTTDDDTIVVQNNLQKKKVLAKSTRTGLNNIIQRYEYLTNRMVTIDDSDGYYSVSLPLLQVTRGSIPQEI